MNETGNREEHLFHAAMQLATPGARAVFLREACAGDDQLHQRLEALLQATQPTKDFLEQPAADSMRNAGLPWPGPTIAATVPIAEKPGDRIGHYQLLEQIGEGGCGVVYKAEQLEPMRRRVALKVIKLGMDTKQVIARFEAERQALALMDHPNIAKVLDAGTTNTGRPYFVMELIKGIRITDFCHQNQLATKERLKLFIQVCRAVQHAHQKGIIHRDLKPSNILVTLLDGVPVPKVIDFGIAKATNQQTLTDKTLFTPFQQFIGTPAYMSPEQANLSGLDIDTQSDIYSLGALLYELLTGKPPFDPEMLWNAGLDGMRRIIREQEPPKPSTQLATAPAPNPQSRRRTPRWKEVDGDLDWIVMKCLEKDRVRRYDTASGLADDLERHLNHEPVEAAAPGAMYRMSKFGRRHRFGLAMASAMTLLLVAGVVTSNWQMLRARRAERQARTVAAFLEDMLNNVRPEQAKGKDTTLLREILDNAEARVDKELTDQPEVQASLRLTIGDTYLRLGQYEKAATALRAAQLAYKANFGQHHLGYARSTLGLGAVAFSQGRYLEAETLSREALAMNKGLFGSNNTNVVNSLNGLAISLQAQGKLAYAEAAIREALGIETKLQGEGNREVSNLRDTLAAVLLKRGRLVEAELLFRRALAANERTLGKEHPDTLKSVNNVALLLQAQGDYAGAEPLCRWALEAMERILGKEHPETLESVSNLANLLCRKGDYAGAEPLYRRALEATERTLGKEHPDTLMSVNNLAGLLKAKGDYAGAEPLFRRALEAQSRTLGKEHPYTLMSVNNLAGLLKAKGDYAGAEPLIRRALEAQTRTLGREHPDTLTSLNNLAGLLQAKGDYSGAEPLYRRALEAQARTLGKGHPDTLASVNNLAGLLEAKGDYAGAEPLFRRALEAGENTLGKDHPDTLKSLNNLADLLKAKGAYAGAEPLYRRALEAQERTLGKEHPDTLGSVNNLAGLLSQKGDNTRAEPLFRRVLEAQERRLGNEHPDTLMSVNNLAELLRVKGDYVGAEPLFRRALEARERTLGKEHPDTLNSVNNLAALLYKTSDHTAAEALFRRALEAQERTLGKEHPDTLSSMNDLAVLLSDRADYVGAEALYRRALEAQERTLGKEHPDTLASVNNLATLLREKTDYVGAEELYRRALEARERTLGKEHPDTLQSVNNLAELLCVKGEYAGAEALLRRMLERQKSTLGAKHPDVVQSLNILARALGRQGKFAEALELERQAISLHLGLGTHIRDQRNWNMDIEALSQAVEKAAAEKDPSPYPYLRVRAFVYGQLGQWQAAADDLSRNAKHEVLSSFPLGSLLLETGDINGYSNRRRDMSVASWGEDPETAAEAAMEMSLRPSESGWSLPVHLAATAVTGGTNHARLPYFQLAKGLVEYRQGHYARAQDWAQKSLAGSGTNYTTAVADWAVLAMAQQQLMQTDDARKAQAQAVEIAEARLPKLESGDLGENWPEWLIARILLREARDLIKNE